MGRGGGYRQRAGLRRSHRARRWLRAELADVAATLEVLRVRGVIAHPTNEVAKRTPVEHLMAVLERLPMTWRVGPLPLAHAWAATVAALLTDAIAAIQV